jgi:ABC-2 type transport system permease protein
MISDVTTVIWKEFKELLIQKPNFRGGWVGLLIFVAVFGILLPLQSGRAWIESPIGIIYWAWVPFMMVSTVIADSFAGERERHTLETLLASCLSDKAILFGKICAAITYGWGITLISLLLGLVTINLVFSQGGLLMYPLDIGLSILGASFLLAALAANLGVLISLRASTIRSAQQTMGIIALLPMILILLIPMLPSSLNMRMVNWIMTQNTSSLIYPIMALILVLDLILLAAALARFQRARLILD